MSLLGASFLELDSAGGTSGEVAVVLLVLSAWSRRSSSYGRAGSSPLKTTNGRASAGIPPSCQTWLCDALRFCCWLLCKSSVAHGPSSGCGLGNVLLFGCSITIVANLGRLKLFVYGGDDPCVLASNASRVTIRRRLSLWSCLLSVMFCFLVPLCNFCNNSPAFVPVSS